MDRRFFFKCQIPWALIKMDGDCSASGRLEASHVYIGQLIEGVMD